MAIPPFANVQALRIEEAQILDPAQILSNRPDKIGYENAPSFRHLFFRLAGMAPVSTDASSTAKLSRTIVPVFWLHSRRAPVPDEGRLLRFESF